MEFTGGPGVHGKSIHPLPTGTEPRTVSQLKQHDPFRSALAQIGMLGLQQHLDAIV